jgi:hypothetical protein
MMKAHTQAALHQLSEMQWFTHVGMRDSDAVDFVTSWEEAIEICAGKIWGDLTNEALNRVRDAVSLKSQLEYNRWNIVVEDVKPDIWRFLRVKTQGVVQDHNLPKIFLDCVEWDLLGYAMALEYSEFDPPDFFSNLIYWYKQGHFPCGWNEATNRLILF